MMFLPPPAVSPRITLHDSPVGVPADAVCTFLGALPDWQAVRIRATEFFMSEKCRLKTGFRRHNGLGVQYACDKGFFFALHIGDFNLNTVARGNINRLAFAGHLFQFDGLVAARVDDFE